MAIRDGMYVFIFGTRIMLQYDPESKISSSITVKNPISRLITFTFPFQNFSN